MSKLRKCHKCQNTYKSRSSLFSILNDNMIYEDYCIQCARQKLKEEGFLTEEWNLKRNFKLDRNTMNGLCYLHAIDKSNKIMANPEKLQRIMNTEPYKKIKEDIDKVVKDAENNIQT